MDQINLFERGGLICCIPFRFVEYYSLYLYCTFFFYSFLKLVRFRRASVTRARSFVHFLFVKTKPLDWRFSSFYLIKSIYKGKQCLSSSKKFQFIFLVSFCSLFLMLWLQKLRETRGLELLLGTHRCHRFLAFYRRYRELYWRYWRYLAHHRRYLAFCQKIFPKYQILQI